MTRPSRDEYRDAVYDRLSALSDLPKPGPTYPFPGDGITWFMLAAGLAVAQLSDDELHDHAEALLNGVSAARARRTGPLAGVQAKPSRFRVLEGGREAPPA